MKFPIKAALCAVAALAIAGPASAHFILLAPDAWIETNGLGDPQKAAPCGTSDITAGVPTGKITEMKGGEMLHFKVRETIFHPGFYRVALSVLDRSELPKDPEATTKLSASGVVLSASGKIDPNPKPPLLVDGLFVHDKPIPKQADGSPTFLETDVKLPNINCDKCTIQILQFMENHPLNKEGEFTYHHCADLKITANAALPIDKGWPGQK
jgi:hypothetical protein